MEDHCSSLCRFPAPQHARSRYRVMSRPSGKKPKNCYIDPRSPHWQYAYEYRGKRDRGSTGCGSAGKAAEFVEARKVEFRKLVDAELAGVKTKTKIGITIAEACDRYEKDRHPQSDAEKLARKGIGNWQTERYQLEYLVLGLGADKLLHEVEPVDWMNYRLARSREKNQYGRLPKGSSINREIELARRVWAHAKRCGFKIGEEPLWRDFIDRGAETKRITVLRAEDEAALQAALAKRHPELALVAEFATLCGQRKAQVCLLQRDHVDLHARTATVYLKRKGEAPLPHKFPLTDRMVEIIKAFPVVKGEPQVFTYECRRSAPPRGDRPARVKGERYPFTAAGWSRDWSAAKADVGLRDFRFHDLRHTAATRLVQAVPNLKIAQKLLGHSDIQTTARYAHAFDEDVLAALNASAERIEQQRAQAKKAA